MRFNSRFGETFVIPKAEILKETAKIYDLQLPTAKMSKSTAEPKGLINIMDAPELITKKIKSAVTDTDGQIIFDPENKPGVSNLLGIHSALSGKSIKDLEASFASSGYGDLKKEVAEVVVSSLEPIRVRTNELLEDPAELDRLLAIGAERANSQAEQTLKLVYERLGLVAAV
jgi:tryptophanyl-tRNA synthetase